MLIIQYTVMPLDNSCARLTLSGLHKGHVFSVLLIAELKSLKFMLIWYYKA